MHTRLMFFARSTSLLMLVSLCASGCGEKPVPVEKDKVVQRQARPRAADSSPAESVTLQDAVAEQPTIDTQRLLDACLKEEQLKEGWVSLFDGQTKFGWFTIGSDDWHVKDGILRVASGPPSFLCTSFQLADYELMVDFKCAADTNSGIFLRSTANPQDVTQDCYELNIAPPDNPFPTGSLVKRQKVEPEAIGPVTPDAWHTFRVLVEGDSLKVWLDGKSVLEYTDPHPLARGYISLQHNSGAVEFRNILMRPLGMKELPVGADWASAWSKQAKPGAEFNATGGDQGLRLKGGSGQVESNEQWDDFVLQATYQLATPSVNSGIFFRCIPGELLNGYECQLNHDFNNGHRIVPTDYGAGGIFNRQKARIVVGEGTDPTYVTLIAEGYQIATWINGLQVTDLADTRTPNANPRKGAKREAGTIALQGHDASTEVVFSKVAVAKIAQSPSPVDDHPAEPAAPSEPAKAKSADGNAADGNSADGNSADGKSADGK